MGIVKAFRLIVQSRGIQAKVLLTSVLRMHILYNIRSVRSTARLGTERLRRPMIDAPYEFDIDHLIMPSTLETVCCPRGVRRLVPLLYLLEIVGVDLI